MTKQDFSECFNRNFDSLRNYVYYRCGDAELATDISQEAFMTIWRKQVPYDMERTTGLLYKIARDLCASHWRKVESRKKYETHLSFGCNTEGLDPEHAMELKELKTLYEKTLSRLPEHQREVFLMSRMEDLTYKEIAVRLGVTVKAVEKRMQIALQVLRKAMAYG